ncbi:MAG: 2-amino-4-hydroxy-6-hydroxymethyldihydropteridine diphosphokinase [Fuerstiella sp.]|nr:2-amino-4-hydroxy-6-hydroxymethyldihydropteridine diphosphokinase [Fuerstiella sp.]
MEHGGITCLIGLGGNTGPVEDTFVAAIQRLNCENCQITALSRNFRTAPMGPDAGGRFTNAAASLNTDLSPLKMLDLLQQVEDDFGRVHNIHWGSRPLDLDLLFYGRQVIHTPRLTVPHPGLWYRRFVLDPLVEIAADWKHPENGHSIAQLRTRLDQRPLVIDVEGLDTLPVIPPRYTNGLAKLRTIPAGPDANTADQPSFCEVRVYNDGEQPQQSGKYETHDFRIDVSRANVTALIEALLTAAIGS